MALNPTKIRKNYHAYHPYHEPKKPKKSDSNAFNKFNMTKCHECFDSKPPVRIVVENGIRKAFCSKKCHFNYEYRMNWLGYRE